MDNLESIDELDSQSDGGIKTVPNSTAVLVLGILSIVGCFCYGIIGMILGIIAIVLHQKDKGLFNSNPKAYEQSFKNSKAGNICAIIGLTLSVLYIILFIVLISSGGNFNFSRSF